MSVRIFPARSGTGWEFDLRIRWPEGGRDRDRGKSPLSAKSASQRWAQDREAALLVAGREAYRTRNAPAPIVTAVPTLAEWWPRVVRDHYEANRKKASTIDAAKSIARNHLLPELGERRLDAIETSDVAALKGRLASKGPKTVNNVLSVLSRSLRCAVEWEVIPALPCRFGLLKIRDAGRPWYEVDDYRRLVAATWSPVSRVLVLLAGSAGLRRGEIIALRWSSVDLVRRHLHVLSAVWRKIEDAPKGWRGRVVPLADELAAALEALKRGRVASVDGDDLVLVSDRGEALSNRTIRNWIARAERRAGLAVGTAREVRDRGGAIHKLRHTFCSHLAIAGVPAKAIQELAGHADLATTQRYMHLSPANRSAAIATLSAFHRGAMRAQALDETAVAATS